MTAPQEPISPLGSTAKSASERRYARSSAYREQHDRLAPYRVIAEAVILVRGARGLTQKELGDLIGTTYSAISRVESGNHPIALETLARLGMALDITFLVGSTSAARSAGVNERCVLVPEIAIERPARVVRPAAVAARPVRAAAYQPTWALADKAPSPVAAKRTGR